MTSHHQQRTVTGVSDCYVFKSQLQEYAQKVGLPAPLYETSKEGPSHKPSFKSTVIVSDVRYDSLPGFSNRKSAEQSAAEIALMELVKSGEMKERISQPVHETGLCKNLLQEYAQKMNYAIPTYACQKDISSGRGTLFSCSVEIGGIRYIGAAAMTKKEAEIKAARTALLAIQSGSGEVHPDGETNHTVVPCKREAPERTTDTEGTAMRKKTKKARVKRKLQGKRRAKNRSDQVLVENAGVRNSDVSVSKEESEAQEATPNIEQSNFIIQSAAEDWSSCISCVQASDHGVLSLESTCALDLASTMGQNVQASDKGILPLRSSKMVHDLASNPNRNQCKVIAEVKGHSYPFVGDDLETINLSDPQECGSTSTYLEKCSDSRVSAGKESPGCPADVHPIIENCEGLSAFNESVEGRSVSLDS